MTISLYFQCFLIAILGSILQMTFKMRSMQIKARLANVEFSLKSYLQDDWIVIVGNVVTVLICLFVTGEVVSLKPEIIFYLRMGFVFIGYTGSDILNRIFSVANKKLNSAIDYKTTQADAASGNLDKPTPR